MNNSLFRLQVLNTGCAKPSPKQLGLDFSTETCYLLFIGKTPFAQLLSVANDAKETVYIKMQSIEAQV